uniref:Putative secreted protein n=1 Tax=Rhipicephalus microplus TaxID=6941 RepID=A0A6G5A7S7_RHIMP
MVRIIVRRLPATGGLFFALLVASTLKPTTAEALYEMYAVTPYDPAGDVFCYSHTPFSYDYPTWAEYFGGGCEGRRCKYSSGGEVLVHHFRCRPNITFQTRRCRSEEEDSSFPDCCLPVCSDALY